MRIAITGGCGFIGTNLALALSDYDVTCIDDLSRRGSAKNRKILDEAGIKVREDDFTKPHYSKFSAIVHLAAQVTVTDSVKNPWHDFEQNALKTILLLENLRQLKKPPHVVFASTNKVYGRGSAGWVNEGHPLAFLSPYAMSKGVADRYMSWYSFLGVPTTTLRLSCTYGPHQWALEGQGWLAWFVEKIIDGEPLTIYGNGRQVRDLLHVSDLCRLVFMILKKRACGVYNVGGGPKNSATLLQVVEMISKHCGIKPIVRYDGERLGDQERYVSDIRKAKNDLGWNPAIGIADGVKRQVEWAANVREGALP